MVRSILLKVVGSVVVGFYGGRSSNPVEIKPNMRGHYLGEFSHLQACEAPCLASASATHFIHLVPHK